MLIGVDSCDEGDRIEIAYNDPKKVTEKFILEGVEQCRIALGGGEEQGMRKENFDYVNRWNKELGRHEVSFFSLPLSLSPLLSFVVEIVEADEGMIGVRTLQVRRS